MSAESIETKANGLLGRVLGHSDNRIEFGTLTCSIYDTAWVGMVSKRVADFEQWLFPCSFMYVLRAQSQSGAWPAHLDEDCSKDSDTILSTLAGLKCLIEHQKRPLQLQHLQGSGLDQRIEKAAKSLDVLLNNWDPDACMAVGFEVLVPSHLDLLEADGFKFSFDRKHSLLEARNQKFSRIPPEVLYGRSPVALLHSLEAFFGTQEFDYDRVAHQKVKGSMMASPSATAAYLIRASNWDDEAEAYLRLAISNGEGLCSGGVPSAFPSSSFEMLWVVSTLLENDVLSKEVKDSWTPRIIEAVQMSRSSKTGLTGFATDIEPDLDDSSKASSILGILDDKSFSGLIVEHYQGEGCLKTYAAERHASISANCNALISLIVDVESFAKKIPMIEEIIAYVYQSWSEAGSALVDKWNLSPLYPAMLITKAFLEILRAHARYSALLFESTISGKLLPVLMQILLHTLQSQSDDGSWGSYGPQEETAYAILTLANFLDFPFAGIFRQQIASAIDRGRHVLRYAPSSKPECIWIEKVTYGSSNLSEAYRLAALHTSLDKKILDLMIYDIGQISPERLAAVGESISKGIMAQEPRWLTLGSWILAQLANKHGQNDRSTSTCDPRDHNILFSLLLASMKHNVLLSFKDLAMFKDLLLHTEMLTTTIGEMHSRRDSAEFARSMQMIEAVLRTFEDRHNDSQCPKVKNGFGPPSANSKANNSAIPDQNWLDNALRGDRKKPTGSQLMERLIQCMQALLSVDQRRDLSNNTAQSHSGAYRFQKDRFARTLLDHIRDGDTADKGVSKLGHGSLDQQRKRLQTPSLRTIVLTFLARTSTGVSVAKNGCEIKHLTYTWLLDQIFQSADNATIFHEKAEDFRYRSSTDGSPKVDGSIRLLNKLQQLEDEKVRLGLDGLRNSGATAKNLSVIEMWLDYPVLRKQCCRVALGFGI